MFVPNSGYYAVRHQTDDGTTSWDCVYASSAKDALDQGRDRFLGLIGEPEHVEMRWFHYAPLKTKTRSLKDQFFNGGKIGCEADGFEIMFVPDLYIAPKQKDLGDGDFTDVHGRAIIRVKDREDQEYSIELEGLDDGHLIDRLSYEVTILVGRLRHERDEPVPTPS